MLIIVTRENKIMFYFTDERDAIQKKTFTKWVNKHLKKVSFNASFYFFILLYFQKVEKILIKSADSCLVI